MIARQLILGMGLLTCVAAADADVFKRIDDGGKVSYSSIRDAHATLVVASVDARNVLVVSRRPSDVVVPRPKTDTLPAGPVPGALFEALQESRGQLIAAQEEFAADAQIPEMVKNGRARNFGRYVEKMRVRENRLELATGQFQEALGQLNEQLTKRQLPSVSDEVVGSSSFQEALTLWRQIQAEVAAMGDN